MDSHNLLRNKTMPIHRWSRWMAAGVAALALSAAHSAHAREGDQTTTVFVGTTSYSDGSVSTFGTTLGAKWALEFQPNLLWTISAEWAATEGETEEAGVKYDLATNTTTAQSGIVYLFNNEPKSVVVGMVGGGLSVLWYDLEYAYPGGDIGDTSGVGPGVFALVGADVRLARNISLIPEYVISAHAIETEDGDSFTLFAAGLVIAIRLSF